MGDTMFEKTSVRCPRCGEIEKEEVILYDESLKRQRISILPVNPQCKKCGAEVEIAHQRCGGRITVLNGTCGSGKTTVAEALVQKGYLAIDGDCAIQTLRYRTGEKKYAWDALVAKVCREIGIVSVFGRDIVLSHIVMPEDLATYLECFEKLGMSWRLILLKPDYSRAAARCRTRVCHTSVTPEEWIRYYYDRLVFDEGVHVIDNSDMSADETAQAVEKLPFQG